VPGCLPAPCRDLKKKGKENPHPTVPVRTNQTEDARV
jgi:hypothetical protein